MKAEIILENIGQYRGVKRFEINSGIITLFQGKNSLGKSTIIRAIAATISSPISSNNLIIEANKFGIIPRENQDAPLVNYLEDYAKITINFAEKSFEATIQKNGKIGVKDKKIGNENFLYACMLVKNSKIQEYLASGNYNFSWIVEEMSCAGKYQILKDTIDSYVRLNDTNLANMEDLNKKIGIYVEDIEKKTKMKTRIENELKNVTEDKKNLDMSQVPEYQKLDTQKKEKIREITKAKKQLKSANDKLNNIQKEIENFESNLKTSESEIRKKQKNIQDIDEKILKLKKYNIQELQDKIIKNQKELPPLSERLGQLRVFKELNNTFYQSRMESVNVCPLCESNVKITPESVKKKVTECNVEIYNVLTKKGKIESDNETLENKIEETNKIHQLKKTRNQDFNTVKQKIQLKNSLENQIKQKKTGLISILQDPEDLTQSIKNINDELVKTVKEMDKVASEYEELKSLLEKEKDLEEQLEQIKVNIETNRELIKEKSEIDVYGLKIPVEKAGFVMNKLASELKKIDTYLTGKINEQKLGAGKKFNSSIKNVITELKLENFEDIQIDLDNYNLVVSKKGGKIQAPGSLGGAEKGIVGGILQVSCKQTYLNEIPFFVVDDILLDFDPENGEKFINYLKKIAQAEDMFIVMTKPTNNPKINQVEI